MKSKDFVSWGFRVSKMKTELEKLLSKEFARRSHLKYPPSNLDEIAEDEFKAGAKFILEMPEVKAAFEALIDITEHEGHKVTDISRNGAIKGFRNNLYVANKALTALRELGVV